MDRIKEAINSVEKSRIIAEKCPCRPLYHFHAPANWMNDPNGPIFYKNEYHIFYQHNPYHIKWGHIHWGHAKSGDLVNWTHLPVALVPSAEKGEKHCFSGDCVINDGIPSIIYTSIGPKKPHKTAAEQWLATSKDDMITWEKYPNNPIMTLDLHGDLEIRDWRDPYLWREGNIWYTILGGHVIKPKRGVALLYKSENLIDWEFINPLIIGEKKTGRNWECPNFFRIDNKYVLIVSPHDKVIYNIGDYKNFKFIPNEWKILDHGLCFYAPNTMIDAKNRVIMWGWIRGGGTGWDGCFTLPRILELENENTLKIYPAPELEKLRLRKLSIDKFDYNDLNNNILEDLNGLCLEIICKFDSYSKSESFGLRIIDKVDNNKNFDIKFQNKNQKMVVGGEEGFINLNNENDEFLLHLFIDRSVIEAYINYTETITSRYYPKTINDIKIEFFSDIKPAKIKSIEVWKLDKITYKF